MMKLDISLRRFGPGSGGSGVFGATDAPLDTGVTAKDSRPPDDPNG